MPTQLINSARHLGRPHLHMRAAILRCFADSFPEECIGLRCLQSAEWSGLLRWLDTSGLALYFLDRLKELELTEVLPPAVLARLEKNTEENSVRTRAMAAEFCSIQREFQSASLSYAVLKGFSLYPFSVPRPELRSQLDLDFLIAEECAPAARKILEQHGYRLHAVSGRSWEFKTEGSPGRSIADIYKVSALRCIELHLEYSRNEEPSLIARAEWRSLQGMPMPALAGPDLFLGQARHLFKHICSECWRTAHLLELHRHIASRRHDAEFWHRARATARQDPRSIIALGVTALLIARTISDELPEGLTGWTVDRVPSGVHRWVESHGYDSVFRDIPGSKLYLLLQRELELAGVPRNRSLRRSLLPLRLPPPIALTPANESFAACLQRYRAQFRFIRFRLRFHVVQGVRYVWESFRWRYGLTSTFRLRRRRQLYNVASGSMDVRKTMQEIAQQSNDNSLTRL